MNLTFSQAVERTKDLAGAIKAARAHEADCAADHAAKQKIADIAGEAHEKASAHCIELEQEREELADHMAALVRQTGEPLAAETAVDVANGAPVCRTSAADVFAALDAVGYAARNIFTEPADFQAAALVNGEARMNEAPDRARAGL